eukprot:TRINITY_DN4558_c0_g1_i4.p1 TRINITY_DN4558_c0_g1~~TRINITY_DN4558_c0_g1_i4.p1  ORF type:complete len:322 (-),score=73.42 TRINITY_DN4558_c0_g1_i4:2013-2954(-)
MRRNVASSNGVATAAAAPVRSTQLHSPSSKATFLALWGSQMASLIGSDIVNYSLRVWTYFETQSVQSFSLITFFTEAPALLLSPFAGVLVDRYPRKALLLASDAVCACSTLAVAVLYAYGALRPWHIYVANALSSVMGAVQWPTFKATVSLLISPEDLVRYGGLDQAAPALSQLLCPVAAGLIVSKYGLAGAFFTEVVTFTGALIITSLASVPSPPRTKEGAVGRGHVWSESLAAWRYISARPGLVGLLLLLANGHLSSGMVRKPLMGCVLLNLCIEQVRCCGGGAVHKELRSNSSKLHAVELGIKRMSWLSL